MRAAGRAAGAIPGVPPPTRRCPTWAALAALRGVLMSPLAPGWFGRRSAEMMTRAQFRARRRWRRRAIRSGRIRRAEVAR